MKINLFALGALLISLYSQLDCVGEKSTNTSGRDEGSKYNVVFEGVLTTQEGHVYKVSEITFNRLIKQIPVFEMPAQDSFDTPEQNKNVRVLKKNPAEKLEITKIDLAETSMISVPNPDVVWYFKKNQEAVACPIECSGSERQYKIWADPRAAKYIEIKVTDKAGEIESYLVEANKKIFCSQITAAGPKEKDVQLPAIKTLTITGYHKRDSSQEACVCPTPTDKKELEFSEPKKPIEEKKENQETETMKISSRSKKARSTKIVRAS
jgi:hypothetical protein